MRVLLYWLFRSVLVGPVARLLWRPWIRGLQHVPHTGPAILASNHLAVVDSLFLPIVLSRQVTFPAKKEYFTGTGMKGRIKRWFFSGVGQVPMDRGGGPAARTGLEALERRLRDGELVGFYPEGTRSPDGRLYRGKTGVARLALAAGVPVIPVVMVGTDKLQPIGRILPRLRPRPGIVFGKPLDFSRYEGMAGDRFVERSMTDEIMYELMQLSGQEYVDVYAAKVKAELGRYEHGERSGPAAVRAAVRAVSRGADPDAADRRPTRQAG